MLRVYTADRPAACSLRSAFRARPIDDSIDDFGEAGSPGVPSRVREQLARRPMHDRGAGEPSRGERCPKS